MKKYLIILVAIALVTVIFSGCTTTPTKSAAPTAYPTSNQLTNFTNDQERVLAFVNEAVAFARANGREKALAEFSNTNGSFHRGEMYIFAVDYNGASLASIALPERVGTSFYDEVDPTGQYYIRKEIDIARSGGGFIDLQFPNPAHGNAVELKHNYVRDVDGTYFVGSGIYSPADASVPNLIGRWSGTTYGHVQGDGFYTHDTGIYNITEQKGYAFAGAKEYARPDGKTYYENFSGAITTGGELFFADNRRGYSMGRLTGPDSLELLTGEDGAEARAFIQFFTRQKL
jgi:hypothetical protein